MSKDTDQAGPETGTDLIVPTGRDLKAFFTADDTKDLDACVAAIKERCLSEVFDPEVPESRKACKALAAKVSTTKVALDNAGKAVGEPAHTLWKATTERRKMVREELEALRDTIREPVDEWEANEEARIAAHNATIEGIRELWTRAQRADATVEGLEDSLERLRNVDTTEMEEFAESAEEMRVDAIKDLDELLDRAIEARKVAEAEAEKRRAELEELEALRAEKAKRDAEEAARAEEAAKVEEAQNGAESAEEADPAPTARKIGARDLTDEEIRRLDALTDLRAVLGGGDPNSGAIAENVLGAIIVGRVRHVTFT